MRIDTHAHVILPETMMKAGKYGPEIVTHEGGRASLRVGPYESRVGGDRGMTAEEFERLGDPRVRLQQLDDLGIDMMGITISPLFYLYWAEDEICTPFASVQNDALSRYCAEDPARLFWMATLPLPNVEASVDEIRRSVELGAPRPSTSAPATSTASIWMTSGSGRCTQRSRRTSCRSSSTHTH